MATPEIPPSDDKDWTWVLSQPCPECGFDSAAITLTEIAPASLVAVGTLQAALARPGAAVRPQPSTWSALEYACHVRDVCTLFRQRLRLMLDEDDPAFANWDQDETALESRYWEQRPEVVAAELDAAAREMASTIDAVAADQWDRPGRRSNGSVFTVATLSRYYLHDLAHHAHDVARPL